MSFSRRTASRGYLEISLDPRYIHSKVHSFFGAYEKVFDSLPNLWVKGGVARSAFVAWATEKFKLYKTEPEIPRDIDLVFFTKNKIKDKESLRRIFKNNLNFIDIEVESSISRYLKTRDVSLNQVILRPNKLIFTKKALKDIRRNKLDPSQYERHGPKGFIGISPRISLRGLLFSLREKVRPSEEILEGLSGADDREILIHLFKAFEKNVEQAFFLYLNKYSIPGRYQTAEEALVELYRGEGPWFRLTNTQEKILNQVKREHSYQIFYGKLASQTSNSEKTTGDGTRVGLFIRLPERISRKFPSLKGDPSPPHVTLLSVGEVSPEQEGDFFNCISEVLMDAPPNIKARLNQIDFFQHPRENRHIPHMAVDFSHDLSQYKFDLVDLLDHMGIQVRDFSPTTFRPHVTLGYEEGTHFNWTKEKPKGIWKFSKIEIWGMEKPYYFDLKTKMIKV